MTGALAALAALEALINMIPREKHIDSQHNKKINDLKKIVEQGLARDYGDDSGTCATVEKCTDDDDKEECKCVAPAAEWYERRYYETLRELEKTRYLLDLSIKEGMRREQG